MARRYLVRALAGVLLMPVALVAQPAPAVPVVAAQRSSLVADVPGVTRGFVTVNGARLHFLDFGGRGEPIVLLAGLGNTSWMWSDFAPRLVREGYRVVALTRRAHGESEAPAGGYGIDTLAADVVAFMDSLGFARANLVGHSLAGSELTEIAAQHSSRVLRLVYVDAAYDRQAQRRYDSILPPPRLSPAMTPSDRSSVDGYLDYQRRARPAFTRLWSAPIERDYRASLAVDSTGAVRWRTPLARYGQILAAAAQAAPDYRVVRAPALALYATVSETVAPPDATPEQRALVERFRRENDTPWIAASIAGFRAGLPDARVERIDGVHHLFLDRPDETLRTIVSFFRTTSPAATR